MVLIQMSSSGPICLLEAFLQSTVTREVAIWMRNQIVLGTKCWNNQEKAPLRWNPRPLLLPPIPQTRTLTGPGSLPDRGSVQVEKFQGNEQLKQS